MDELAGLLSRERLLLELMLFKLVTLKQLLVSGEARFLTWAAEEVDRATEKVRQAELHRSIVVAGMAADRGLDPDGLSLRALAEDSPEPWRTIFADYRTAFLRLAYEIEETMSAARRLAHNGVSTVVDTLERVAGGTREPEFAGAATYGPSATWEATAPAARVSRTL